MISNDTTIIGTDAREITHGEHFLNIFQNTIFEYTVTNIDAIMHILDKLLHHNLSFLLKWFENLLLYLKQYRQELRVHVDNVVDAILQRFARYRTSAVASNDIDNCMERLINVYGMAVHLKSKPMEIELTCKELYMWIYEELMSNRDIEYKILILQNFLVCLIDATYDGEPQLSSFLHTLKISSRASWPQSGSSSSSSSSRIETNMSVMEIYCFDALLKLLSVSGSSVLLKCVIHFAAGSNDHLFDDKLHVKDHLRQYYRREPFSMTRVLSSLEMTHQKFMNTVGVNVRLDILRKFLLPAFEFCDEPAIERFFERNIRELYTINRQCITDDTNAEHIIVSKIGCYQLLTIMFAQVELNKLIDVNGAIMQNAGLDKDRGLLHTLVTDTVNVRALKVAQPNCQNITRLLQCAAYNCTLAILSLKNDERFYNTMFGENEKKELFIWKNIVDCTKVCQFEKIFHEYPETRETVINVRSSSLVDGEGRDAVYQRAHNLYIHNYDLMTSTLSEDINAYDFNKSIILPRSSNSELKRSMISVVLESDDFNKHECMPYICGVLNHISSLKNETSTSANLSKPPKWLESFIHGMRRSGDVPNIQLFMLKIVVNTADTVFKSYAKFMLQPIAQVVAYYLEKYDLNYIIRDILEILIDWPTSEDDVTTDDRKQIQRLFEALIDRTAIEKCIDFTSYKKAMYNYNLELIEKMMKKWQGCLASMVYLDRIRAVAPKATVYLILVMFRNCSGMAREIVDRPSTVDRPSIADFLLDESQSWFEEDILLQCCECLGLYLKTMQHIQESNEWCITRVTKMHEVKSKVFMLIRQLNFSSKRQVKCIICICREYPDLAIEYYTMFRLSYKNLEKFYCLELFQLLIPRLDDADKMIKYLRHTELENVLANREARCEKIALRIVRDLATMTTISPTDLLILVNQTVAYIKDDSTELRELVYDIHMAVYKRYGANVSDDASVTALQSMSARNLLAGLLDPSHELQACVLRFLMEETNLGMDKSKERLIAVLDMHSPEDAYALLVPLLMLHLASQSIDYTEKLFEPLYDRCTYEDYKINVSWRRQNLSYVTPMFVDSLASQISSTFSQSIDNDSSTHDPTTSYRYQLCNALRLRATQELQFEPTLINDDGVDADEDAAAVFGNSPRHNIEFGHIRIMPSRQHVIRSMRHRKYLTNSTDVANRIREKNIQKNVQRTEMMKQEIVRQRSSVRLYR